MSNIFQLLDGYRFDDVDILDRRQTSPNFCAGLDLTKAPFLEAYMSIRKQVYSPNTIIEGWRRCGLLENSSDVALAEYRRQMHHNIATPQVSAQEESVIEAEVGENPALETQPKRRMKKKRFRTDYRTKSSESTRWFKEETSQVTV